jgi:hypothetical protein
MNICLNCVGLKYCQQFLVETTSIKFWRNPFGESRILSSVQIGNNGRQCFQSSISTSTQWTIACLVCATAIVSDVAIQYVNHDNWSVSWKVICKLCYIQVQQTLPSGQIWYVSVSSKLASKLSLSWSFPFLYFITQLLQSLQKFFPAIVL